MSYLAFYRKYRSRTFDEILGQDHITVTLKNQIMNDKIAHAYLFCGIRGTGKTSIAKILGKAVNCENNVDGNPCLECAMCKSIDNDSEVNVIEIDAASNNGVDDVRNIRNDLMYMPQKGKYKVYIIDEVHMLSMSAFNALLKVLEEPPKHVIFILATTESQKIPATILSRCQRFDLKRISRDLMIERIKEYIQIENIQIEDGAIRYIVSLSEGSMRDALSILEQISSIKSGELITLDDVLRTLGNVDYSVYQAFTKSLIDKDVSSAIDIVNKIYENGKEMKSFVNQYITYLRNLLLIKNSSSAVDVVDMSKENIEEIRKLSEKINSESIIEYVTQFSKVEAEMRYASMPKLSLEILVIKLCNLSCQNVEKTVSLSEPVNMNVAPKQVETQVEKKVEAPNVSIAVSANTNNPVKENVVTNKILEGSMSSESDAKKIWKEVIRNSEASLHATLENVVPLSCDNTTFSVGVDNGFRKATLERKSGDIEKILLSLLGRCVKLIIIEKVINDQNVNKNEEVANTSFEEVANDFANDFANLGVNVTIK